MSAPVLQLSGVSRVYVQGDNSLSVLHDLNLALNPGEVTALVGPSGSGKSTLLQIAGLLDSPTAGQVTLGGEAMHNANDTQRTLARRKYLGFVYQFHHLLPEFSAAENVMLPQMIAGKTPAEARRKALLLLGELGLEARVGHRPARLSGGEQQRVAIARALANDPLLLLADEPTGNLDPDTAEVVFSMLMRLANDRRLAVLVATHNLDLARRMSRIATLEGGRLK